LAAGLTPLAASANPGGTDLVITEVYVNGGSAGATYVNKFVEIYNPTASAISLTGKSVQYRSATGAAAANNVCALAGSVAAGGYFLVQGGSNAANGIALPTPDQVCSAISPAAAGGTVFLATVTTATTPTDASVVDRLGYGTSNAPEGTAASVPSVTTSLQRTKTPLDTDNNSVDFTLAAPAPQNAASTAGPLTATSPGNKTGQVGIAISSFTLAANGGTAPYTWNVTGLPAGVSATSAGVVSGTPTVDGTFNVTATATDSATPTPATAQTTFTFTVNPAASLVPIAQIQGTGATSPVAGQNVKTQGVVTASYPTGGLNGFYIQTPGADTPDASDAIFVYGGVTGFTTYPAIGDSVQVSGQANEFSGATQITATDAGVTPVSPSLGTVTPKTVIPGTDCELPGTACPTQAEYDVAREVAEGELFQPTAPWTASDVYDGGPAYNDGTNSGSFRGEIGVVANSTKPLVAPTEVIDAQATALVNERKKYNAAKRIILDDGSSWTYSTTQHQNDPFPWFTKTRTPRVGSAITFPKPVIFTFGFNAWRILPQAQVVGDATGTIDFSQTRPAAPQNVGGDVKLATFNVLNFFPTTGEEFVALGGGRTCTYFRDRDGNNITNNSCNPNGPRGAANDLDPARPFQRQRDKIVAAINTADADIVSLEELENSVKFGKDRDFAITQLVAALNADAGAGTWAFAPSPSAANLPALADQDVIRSGFIYQPANVALVGESVVLSTQSSTGGDFEDAREPLAQAFKKVGTPDARAFAVIVNHFKSKGSGTPDPDGQGNANDRRVLQAQRLVTFANDFKTQRGISRVFLAGDFNAYSQEDPIQVLEAAGYESLDSTSNPDEETYNFDGQVGSLDHVLANSAALADVNAVDVWDINGYESVYYEYSRFNSNATDLYVANQFRSSDHSPEIVGINTGPSFTDVQIIGSNDYHGRLAAGPRLAAYVKAARAANPDTVFAAAGDMVGATTFESFIQHDKPTIDVMNEAGLDVSAVGNHEFDAGYDDLVNRIMKPYDATTNPEGGAKWKYLGANVKFKADNSPALDGTWIKDFGPVEVGFVGAVTEDLPSLVSGDGIADIKVTDIVDATNAAATELKAEGADVVVLLVHEGAGGTSYASATTPGTAFGDIVNGVSPDVDAIVSGHTHLAYNHSVPVPAWVAEGRTVTERPVVSAGQYGENLNKLVFTVDNATGKVTAKTQAIVPFGSFPTTGDAATQTIVNDANAKAAVLGAQPLGKISAGFSRAKFATGAENRGGESTLNNLVAEVQRWSTDTEIAFMNPGGLRADMTGTGTDYPRTVTYKNAADVQPFANTLVKMGLTGSSIKKILEQQWQRLPNGTVPSRPFLKLGVSNGFEYTYDPTRAEGDRITGMWLDGVAIDPATTYQVAANAFLASGTGDNFFGFSEAIGKRDSGKVDLAAMVDYMATYATDANPLGVDYAQRAIGVRGVAADYAVGQTVTINLSSLAMTGAGDKQDATVAVTFDGQPVGSFPVDNAANPAGDVNSNDEAGKATVSFRVPAVDTGGVHQVVITGASTGTSTTVPVTVQAPTKVAPTVTATATPSTIVAQTGTSTIAVEVTAPGGTPTGTVAAVLDGEVVGGGQLVNGKVDVPVGPFATAGAKDITIHYYGDAATLAGEAPVSLTVTPAPVVEKSDATVTATVAPTSVQAGTGSASVSVTVASSGQTPTGAVVAMVDGKVVGGGELSAGTTTFTVGPFATPGTKVITVKYFGDDTTKAGETTTSLTVTPAPVEEKAAASITSTVTPASVTVMGGRATVSVTVSKASGVPTGGVLALVDGAVVGAGQLVDGKADISLPSFATAGTKSIELRYLGDDTTKPASSTASLVVAKAVPTLKVKAPKKVEKGKKATIVVTVGASGFHPTGTVTVGVRGKKVTKTLAEGVATFKVRLTKLGSNKVVVTYSGDDRTESASKTRIIKVKRG
jgi:5'-nucleotidase